MCFNEKNFNNFAMALTVIASNNWISIFIKHDILFEDDLVHGSRDQRKEELQQSYTSRNLIFSSLECDLLDF